MNLLETRGLTKSFFGIRVLHGLDLALAPGEVLGLVGENGSGKSTSMNIVGGLLPPDTGTMALAGQPYQPRTPRDSQRAGIAFIHQELNLFPNLSIEDNLNLASFPLRWGVLPLIDRGKGRQAARRLLEQVNLTLSPATSVSALSPGEKQLVEIAKALGRSARVMIFDEPTTSLTAHETERLFGIIAKLKARGLGLIYISHILKDVLRLCDRVLVLRDGAMVGGGPARELTEERIITLMVGRKIEQIFPPRTTTPTNRVAVELRGVSQPGIVRDVSLRLHAGEVLGLSGLLGSGRSELAQIIFGLAPRQRGEMVVAGQPLPSSPQAAMGAGLAFLTEDRRAEGLLGQAALLPNVALPSLRDFSTKPLLALQAPRLRAAVETVAAAVQVRGAALDHPTVLSLSGGNQQKVVLAKWLLRAPKVFLLDEPTRGIDVGAKFEIYKIINELAANGTGVLLISSEIEELIGMCDRILVMRRGEVSAEFARDSFDRETILRAAMQEAERVVA